MLLGGIQGDAFQIGGYVFKPLPNVNPGITPSSFTDETEIPGLPELTQDPASCCLVWVLSAAWSGSAHLLSKCKNRPPAPPHHTSHLTNLEGSTPPTAVVSTYPKPEVCQALFFVYYLI